MYTLKHVVQLKEKYKEDIEVYVFFMDMRSPGKGYEEFYDRARDRGVNFIRGRVSRIEEDSKTHNMVVYAEDANLGVPIEVEAEMVVLATAGISKKGSADIARIINLSRGADGFFMESHPKLKPNDAPTDGVFYAGACQGLKDIPSSVSQGSAAAARAATVLSKAKWKIEPIISIVDETRCRNRTAKCGVCVDKCPYGAIKAEPNKPAHVTTASCHGCGTCVAECPQHAITQMHFTDAQIMAQVRAALEDKPEEKVIAFLCNWCSYAGADLAGISRCEYPPSVRVVRVMCSGRVDREFILEAFRLGAGMVLVGACHLPYDCHYISGNYKMKVRTDALKGMLIKLGMSPERFRVEYVSAAEGIRYAEVIKEIDTDLKALGKGKILKETEKMRPLLENMLKRKATSAPVATPAVQATAK